MICYPVGWGGCGGGFIQFVREAAKKVIFLMPVPLRPYPPPPSSLMAVGTFKKKFTKSQRKFFFFLMASTLPPYPSYWHCH